MVFLVRGTGVHGELQGWIKREFTQERIEPVGGPLRPGIIAGDTVVELRGSTMNHERWGPADSRAL